MGTQWRDRPIKETEINENDELLISDFEDFEIIKRIKALHFKGTSIVKIEKTSTQGIVDTYTISFSNGTIETFNVTNGLKINWRGGYESEIEYSKNDAVRWQGASYIYINATPTTGNLPPPTGEDSNEYWDTLVTKAELKYLNVDADIPITTNDTFAADATDYIETNYSRQPTDGDMLIFTFSDLLNSEYGVLFLKDSWIKLGGELGAVDLGNYYNKQQTYSNEEAVASISEVVTIDETDYQLTRAGNIIYCTDEVYQALYDGGILDNEPYASMIFFTSK